MPVQPKGLTTLRRFTRRSALAGGAATTWLLLAPAAWAADTTAETVIQTLIDDAFAALKDAELKKDPKKRLDRLQQIVDAAFDWTRMSKSCLGFHWRDLTEEQRAEFVGVFKKLLANRYKDDLDRFKGTEKVEIRSTLKPSDEIRKVKTVLITASKETIPIDYTLFKSGSTWKVEDVSIEHVSMATHYRDTFNNFLANHTFAEMMEKLKQRLGQS